MGQILEARCGRCDYSRRLYVGGGLADCDEEAALAPLSEEGRSELEALLEKGVDRLAIRRSPVRCVKCGEFFAQAVVSGRCGARTFAMQSPCPACGSTAGGPPLAEDEPVRKGCPRCGGDVRFSPAGHWD